MREFSLVKSHPVESSVRLKVINERVQLGEKSSSREFNVFAVESSVRSKLIQ